MRITTILTVAGGFHIAVLLLMASYASHVNALPLETVAVNVKSSVSLARRQDRYMSRACKKEHEQCEQLENDCCEGGCVHDLVRKERICAPLP